MSERALSKQLDRLMEELAESPLIRDERSAAMFERIVARSQWGFLLTGTKFLDEPTFPVELGTVAPPDSEPWKAALFPYLELLRPTIASVGRLVIPTGDGGRALKGTGWLVRPDVVATNRHIVAGLRDEVANQQIDLRIDFLGEHGSAATLEFPVVAVEWFIPHADDPNLDLAFVRIDRGAGPAVALQPIALAQGTQLGATVAALGYPERPGQTYGPEFDAAFAGIFGVKRLSPGKVLGVTVERVYHNCTTLGGSSGGPVVDIATGQAVALNCGEDLTHNLAIPAALVRQHLEANFP